MTFTHDCKNDMTIWHYNIDKVKFPVWVFQKPSKISISHRSFRGHEHLFYNKVFKFKFHLPRHFNSIIPRKDNRHNKYHDRKHKRIEIAIKVQPILYQHRTIWEGGGKGWCPSAPCVQTMELWNTSWTFVLSLSTRGDLLGATTVSWTTWPPQS